MFLQSRRVRAAATAFAATLILAGCADDDEPTASPSEPISATPTPTASLADFCDAKVAIDAAFLGGGPPEEEGTATATPDPAEIKAGIEDAWGDLYADLEQSAPADVKSDVEALVAELDEAIEAANPEFFFEPGFVEADNAVDQYLIENCEDINELDAVAADFEFTGLPTVTPEGLTALTLTNEGEEFHEMILMRINDGVEESIEEILQLDEEEAESMVTPMGVTLAAPGVTATNFFELEPGNYAVLCFISKDSTEANGFQGDGPPHFTEGMVEELRVLAAGESSSPSPTSTSTSTSGSSSSSSSEAEVEDETSSPRPSSTSTSTARPTSTSSS